MEVSSSNNELPQGIKQGDRVYHSVLNTAVPSSSLSPYHRGVNINNIIHSVTSLS